MLVFDTMEAIRSRLGITRVPGRLSYGTKTGLRGCQPALHLPHRGSERHRRLLETVSGQRLDARRPVHARIGAGRDLRQTDDDRLMVFVEHPRTRSDK